LKKRNKAKTIAFFISISVHTSLLAASVIFLTEPEKPQNKTEKRVVVSLSEYVKPQVKKEEPKIQKEVVKQEPKKIVKKKVVKKKIPKKIVKKKEVLEEVKPLKKVKKQLVKKEKKEVKEKVVKEVVEKIVEKKVSQSKKIAKLQTLPKEPKKETIEPSFLDEIRSLIQSSLRYPSMARRLKIQGVVLVSFKLDQDAKVVMASVKKSSGSSLLDSRALDTVKDLSGRYPTLSRTVELKIPIAFSLNKNKG